MPDTLLLVDAYAHIYRAFYAIRHLTGPAGQPVNAIFGFTKMLRKQIVTHQPTHLAVVYDLGAPQKRLDVLPTYKEQRPPTPPDLVTQLPAIREILAGLRIPVIESDGEEADDIIATLARQAADQGLNILIASNDKDFAQLVDDRIKLLRPGDKGDEISDAGTIQARYGVTPAQIVDYLSLLGDTVDNIPGIPGVGEKTAAALLAQFGSIAEMTKRAAEITKPKLQQAITDHTAQLDRNRQLVALHTNLNLPVKIPALVVQRPDYPRLITSLRSHGFKGLTAEVEAESNRGLDLFGSRG